MSIRLRLTLWHTALLGFVLAGFAVLVYLAVARQLTSELNYEIQLRALSASRTLRGVSPGWSDQRAGPPDQRAGSSDQRTGSSDQRGGPPDQRGGWPGFGGPRGFQSGGPPQRPRPVDLPASV